MERQCSRRRRIRIINSATRMMMVLTVSLSLILTTITTTTVVGTIGEAYDRIQTKESQLKFVSATTSTNTTSIGNNATSNSTMIQIPEKGYLVEEILDNLYWVTDGNSITLFMVTDEGVVVVDAPPEMGTKYLEAVAEVTEKPITHVIYTHAHLDHIGAAGIFPRNATYIAHQDTAAEIQRAINLAKNDSMIPPVPTIAFPNNYTLQIGNQTLNLDYYGTNHSPGNIFIYAPNQKTLMLADILTPGWAPFVYLALSKDVTGFIDAHDIALNYDFDTFIGGHLDRPGTREDVLIHKEFAHDLGRAAAKAISEVEFADIATEVGTFDDPGLLITKYFDARDKNCVDTMLPEWESKLRGARTFMPTNCFAMAEAATIDPSVSAILQNSTMDAASDQPSYP